MMQWYLVLLTSTIGASHVLSLSQPCDNPNLFFGQSGGNATERQQIQSIRVIFQKHLDVGFIATPPTVCQTWFEHILPAWADTALSLSPGQFHVMTYSWLLHEYLFNTTGCWPEPRPKRELVVKALQLGYISWPANPGNNYVELQSQALFEAGLDLDVQLRDFLWPHRTERPAWTHQSMNVAKQSDIAGTTRASVPLLTKAKVQFMHVGVNGAIRRPVIPTPLFRWLDLSSNTSLFVAWEDTYGSYVQLSKTEALVWIFQDEGLDIMPWTTDNVQDCLQKIQTLFPNASHVQASSLQEAAARLLVAVNVSAVPVVTSEIGTSWLYGAASDPQRAAMCREDARQWSPDSHNNKVVIHRLLKGITEHNYQLDVNHFVPQNEWNDTKWYYEDWSDKTFRRLRTAFQELDKDRQWQRRAYCTNSIGAKALEVGNLPPDWEKKRHQLVESTTGPTGPTKSNITAMSRCGNSFLWPLPKGWMLYHQRCGSVAFDRYIQNYLNDDAVLGDCAFSKCGLRDTFAAECTDNSPTTISGWYQANNWLVDYPCLVHYDYGFADWGGVIEFWMHNATDWDVTVEWTASKTASRLPEAMFWSYYPVERNVITESISVLGSWLDPFDVISHGSKHVFALDDNGVRLLDAQNKIQTTIQSWDAPLVLVGSRQILESTQGDATSVPDRFAGVHFNLANNYWATAFSQYWEGPALFRFHIHREPLVGLFNPR